MYEKAINAVLNYIDDRFFEPQITWPKQYFLKRSYSRFGANKLLERIIEEELKTPPHISGREKNTPAEIALNLMTEFDYYQKLSKTSRARNMFAMARIAVEEILCTCL